MKKAKTILAFTLLMMLLVSCACAESDVTEVSSNVNEDGSLTVSWSYSGSEDPVTYVLVQMDDPFMQSAAAALAEDSSATLYGVLCGHDYSIDLIDSSFYTIESAKVSVPHEDFTDLKTLKYKELGVIKMDAGENKFRNKNIVKSPKAESISEDIGNGVEYNFYVRLHTPAIAKGARSYITTTAVTAPNGYTETVSTRGVLENEGEKMQWTLWPLSLEPFYTEGALTSGQYIVSFYLDGGLVDTKTIEFK